MKWNGVFFAVPLFLVSFSAWGESGGPGGAPSQEVFQAHKAKRVQFMEAQLACVRSANAPEDMRKCDEAAKQRHQGEAMERIQEQRQRLDEEEKRIRENRPPGGKPPG